MLNNPEGQTTKTKLLKRMEHLRKLFKSYDQRESEDGGERGPKKREQNIEINQKTQFEEVQVQKRPAVSISQRKTSLRWKKRKSSKDRSTEKIPEKESNKKDEQELLPLTEVLHHRDFRNACKMMTEIKNRKMIDRLLNANDSGIIRKMFENDIIEPTKVEVKLLHRALNSLWEELMCNIAELKFEREVVVLLCEREKAKARFLDVMLLYPQFIPDTWGGQHLCGLMKGYEGQQRIPDDDGAGLIHPPIVRTVSSHWTKQLQQVLIEQKLKGQEQTFSVRAETEQVAERNMKAISDKAIDPQVNNVDEGVALKAVDSEENQVAELTKRRKTRKKKQSRSRKLTRRTTTTVDQQMTAKTSDDPYLQREKISDKKGVKDSIGASCKSPEIKILKTEKEERNGIEHVATTQNSTSLKEMLPKSSDDKFGDPKERPKIGGGINRPESPETDERQTQEGDMEESINKEVKDFSAKDKDEKKDTMSELTGKSQKERRNEKPEITLEVTKEQLDKKQMTEDEIEKRKEEKMSAVKENSGVKATTEEREMKKDAGKHEQKLSGEKISHTNEKLAAKTQEKEKEKQKKEDEGKQKEEKNDQLKEKLAGQAVIESRETKDIIKNNILKEEPKKKNAAKEVLTDTASKPNEKQNKAKNSGSGEEHNKKIDLKVKEADKEHKRNKSAESGSKESGDKKPTGKKSTTKEVLTVTRSKPTEKQKKAKSSGSDEEHNKTSGSKIKKTEKEHKPNVSTKRESKGSCDKKPASKKVTGRDK